MIKDMHENSMREKFARRAAPFITIFIAFLLPVACASVGGYYYGAKVDREIVAVDYEPKANDIGVLFMDIKLKDKPLRKGPLTGLLVDSRVAEIPPIVRIVMPCGEETLLRMDALPQTDIKNK